MRKHIQAATGVATLALSVIASALAAANEWTNVGPEGGGPRFLVIDPQDSATFYAGTDAGLYKSTDRGLTWNNTGMIGLSTLAIDRLASSTLYGLAPGDDNSVTTILFKSTDGGENWSDIFWLPQATRLLAIDPHVTGTLYALAGAGPLYAIFKSTDGGASFTVLPGLPNNAYFLDLAIDQQGSLFAAAVGNLAGRPIVTVYKSRDGGTSWADSGSGLPASNGAYFVGRGALTIDLQNPGTIYVARQDGVYKSTDGGASWRAANLGMTTSNLSGPVISGVAIDPQNANTLYAPAVNSIFKSVNGGLSWSPLSSWPRNAVLAPGLVADQQNAGTVYALTASGMYRSVDGGAAWNVYFRPRAATVSSLVMDPLNSGTIYAGRYKSTDAGMTWAPLGTGNAALAIDPQSPWNLYGGSTYEDCPNSTVSGISKSVDGGGTWTNIRSQAGCVSAMAADPLSPSTIYAADGRIFKSTDAGGTWITMNSGLGGVQNALAIDPLNSGTVYAAGRAGVFKSTDGGTSWSASGLTPVTYSLAIDPMVTSTLYAGTAANLLKSTDGGANWRGLLSSTPTNVYAVAINPQNTSIVYAGTDTGIIQSTDGGESWAAIPGGPANVRLLAVDPQMPATIYAGGPAGLFAISLDAQAP
jgi:photosystem II stability/assembly factor-like uncharacterized protein